jgi:L-ascorbate metabolism protein UlaG (beta-lactamase superfamily)
VRVIRPLQSGAALVEDVRRADPGSLNLWWLGQSGFLVAWEGRHLLLDPYLSDSLTRKYAETDKPHVRMTELVVEPSALAFVDVVTASHAHTDHLDPDTLRALAGVPIVAPEAHRALVVERAGADPLGIDDGETVEVAGFSITAVPAAHDAIERDAAGHMLHLGYVVRCGPFAIYHAGDTIPYDGQAERVGPVDVALLPINGRRPERRVAGNLWGDEAAALAHAIGAGVAVPMHYELFAFNTEPPYRVLRAGERLTRPRGSAAGTSSAPRSRRPAAR